MARRRFDLAQVGQQFGLAEIFQLLGQHLRVADHRRERRAQLVAHVGDELALGAVGGLRRVARPVDLGFGLLAVGDVDMHADPFAQRPVLGDDGGGPHLHVAPGAVAPAHPVLDLEGRARLDGPGPGIGGPGAIVRVHRLDPAPALAFLVALAGIGGPAPLPDRELAVGVRRPDDRRGTVDEGAEALLGVAQALLGGAPPGDVGVGAVPAQDPPGGVARGLGPRQEPAEDPVGALQGKRILPRLAAGEGAAEARLDPIEVVGVVDGPPAPALHRLEGGAGVVVPALIVPDDRAVGLGDPGELGQRFGKIAIIVRLQGALAHRARPRTGCEGRQSGIRGLRGEAPTGGQATELSGRGPASSALR